MPATTVPFTSAVQNLALALNCIGLHVDERSWTLSQDPNGIYIKFAWQSHPAKYNCVSFAAGQGSYPGQGGIKHKSPGRRLRDRRRWNQYHGERKGVPSTSDNVIRESLAGIDINTNTAVSTVMSSTLSADASVFQPMTSHDISQNVTTNTKNSANDTDITCTNTNKHSVIEHNQPESPAVTEYSSVEYMDKEVQTLEEAHPETVCTMNHTDTIATLEKELETLNKWVLKDSKINDEVMQRLSDSIDEKSKSEADALRTLARTEDELGRMKIKYRREKANYSELTGQYSKLQLKVASLQTGSPQECTTPDNLEEENIRLRQEIIKLKYDMEAIIYQHRAKKND